MCTGNKIKSMTGDAADCNIDTACDGITKVPNSVRTTCGKNDMTGVFLFHSAHVVCGNK